jgi:ketosteroid isomerase-like protein
MSDASTQELRALNERYFHALDQRDLSAVGECFTDDAVSIYLGGDWEFTGRDALVERLAVIKTFDSSIHVPTTMSFSVAGHVATGTVYAIAHLALADREATRIVVRGLRYVDEYSHDQQVWRISRRRQDPMWQYEVPAVNPEVPGQRAHTEQARSNPS